MKRLLVLTLVALLVLVGWALPAGAEKVRLTEDQMDTVSAGLVVPGFPVDITKEFGGSRTFPQLWGLEGNFQAEAIVQAPCQTAPSLLCMSLGSMTDATLWGHSAGIGTGGGFNLINFGGGNKIFQGGGGAMFFK